MPRLSNIGSIQTEVGVNTFAVVRRLAQSVEDVEATFARIIRNGELVASHANLEDLDYASSGHTGFASSAALTAHTANTTNPHSVTLTQAEAAGGAITEGAITDGSILARVAANETISGDWTFSGANTYSGDNTFTSLLVNNKVSRVDDGEYAGYDTEPKLPLVMVAKNVEKAYILGAPRDRAGFQIWVGTDDVQSVDTLFAIHNSPTPDLTVSKFYIDTDGYAYRGDFLGTAYTLCDTGGQFTCSGIWQFNASLKTQGGLQRGVTQIDHTDSTYLILETDDFIVVDTTTAAVTVTLPAITGAIVGKTYRIINPSSGANNVTVDTTGADTIQGVASDTVIPNQIGGYANDGVSTWYLF